jgi:thiamine biosynthesis lipoprotein
MALGLGGIAKGYALDLAAAELQRRGYHHFLLYAGGQILAAGTKEGGASWKTGVQDPRGGPDDVFASFEVSDVSVSTSGDYQHAFVAGGVRYHHIIDLASGFPAQASRSATVIASSATLADAYSKPAFILGPERALDLARERGFELLLVDSAGTLHGTPELKARAVVYRHPIGEAGPAERPN